MPQEPTTGVREEVQVTDRVTQATRVFLAGAISLGAMASAMGFFFFGDIVSSGGGKTPSKIQPLMVNDITAAASWVGLNDGQGSFQPLDIQLGSTQAFRLLTMSGEVAGTDYLDLRSTTTNQPLILKATTTTASNWNFFGLRPKSANAQATPFSIESIQGATTFSIEPLPVLPYINTQFLRLAYKRVGATAPTTINICVGVTSQTTLYVAQDGSTYTDKNLTRRTTSQGCQTIISRAMKVGDVTNIDFAQDPSVPVSPENEFFVHRTGALGKMRQSDIEYQKIGQPRENFSDPVMVTYRGSNPSGDDTQPFVIPDMVINILDYSVVGVIDDNPDPLVYTVCFPGTQFTHGNIGQAYYFDTTGRAYYDIMLSRPASPVTCNDVKGRALKVSNIRRSSFMFEPGQGLPADGGWNIRNGKYLVRKIRHSGEFQEIENVGNSQWPIFIEPYFVSDLPGLPRTTANAKLYLAGDWMPLRDPSVLYSYIACVPSMSITYDPNKSVQGGYFYDTNGYPYTDIFLRYRANSNDNCQQTVSGAYAPRTITNMTSTVTQPAAYQIHAQGGNHWYGDLSSTGFTSDADMGPFQGLPFSLELAGWPEPTNVPVQAVTVTDDTGATKTLCWGPYLDGNPLNGSTIVYYNSQGQGYRDIFLTQAVSCSLPSIIQGDPIEDPIDPNPILR